MAGGFAGAIVAYSLEYYCSAVGYKINIGGRPLNSWPQFIPVVFELTVLGASFAAFFGSMILNGLPQPYHPLFNVPNFKLASQNRLPDPRQIRVEERAGLWRYSDDPCR